VVTSLDLAGAESGLLQVADSDDKQMMGRIPIVSLQPASALNLEGVCSLDGKTTP
jgi:hypothetical protein